MEPTIGGVADAMESQGWDLCQGGLELGSRYGRTQLEHDAIWNRAQQLPQGWMAEFEYGPRDGRRADAVRFLLEAVREVRAAPEDELVRMLPHDHPERCRL